MSKPSEKPMTEKEAGYFALSWYCKELESQCAIWSQIERAEKESGVLLTGKDVFGIPFRDYAKFHFDAIDLQNNLKRAERGLKVTAHLSPKSQEWIYATALHYVRGNFQSEILSGASLAKILGTFDAKNQQRFADFLRSAG